MLSGTGSDGTLGLRAVKGEGGMAMAQNPESTEYDGMPRNAIATGLVDFVLPPSEMPRNSLPTSLTHLADAPAGLRPGPQGRQRAEEDFVLLRAQTGHDFSQYKQNTVYRRVERRMAVQQIEQLGEYVRYLQQTPAEVDALFRDLLIGVTSFFRDREAFAALEEQVIPTTFPGQSLRRGNPCLGTRLFHGEEAYSLAMLLQEQMEALKQAFKLQVFATDLDRQAIEQARAGVYPPASPPTSRRNASRHFSARSRHPALTASRKSSATYWCFPNRT